MYITPVQNVIMYNIINPCSCEDETGQRSVVLWKDSLASCALLTGSPQEDPGVIADTNIWILVLKTKGTKGYRQCTLVRIYRHGTIV
jgi:hypothetical protein